MHKLTFRTISPLPISAHLAHELTQPFSQPTPLEGCCGPPSQGDISQLLIFPPVALDLLNFMFCPVFVLFWSSLPLYSFSS